MKLVLNFLVLLVCLTIHYSDGNTYCEDGWVAKKGMCARLYSKDIRLSPEKCHEDKSELLVIKTQEKLRSLQQAFKNVDTYVWLDLRWGSVRGIDGSRWYWHQWAHGSNQDTALTLDVLKWNQEPESITNEKWCAALTDQGTYVTRLCDSTSSSASGGYICHLTLAKSGDPCPKPFQKFGKLLCVAVSKNYGIEFGNYNWAVNQCRKMNGSKLMHDPKTQFASTFVIQTLLKPYINLWYTDLTAVGKIWKWGQNVVDTKTIPWAKEPNNLGRVEQCAAVYLHTGRLVDIPCDASAGLICQKPPTKPLSFSPFTGKFGCGKRGWVRGGMSCYLIGATKVTWDEGIKQCRGHGGDLVQVDTNIEMHWLSNSLESGWTGLCYKDKNWRWQDGKIYNKDIIQWSKEPMPAPYQLCGVVATDGYFYAEDCKKAYKYICEERVTDSSKCPDHWTYFNKSCYHLVYDAFATYMDAKFACRAKAHTKDAYLFIPSYKGECDYIHDHVLPKKTGMGELFWTGFTDGNTGRWGGDSTPDSPDTLDVFNVDHLNWKRSPGKRSDADQSKYCTVINDKGRFVDVLKTDKRQAICEVKMKRMTALELGGGGSSMVKSWSYLVVSVVIMIGRVFVF